MYKPYNQQRCIKNAQHTMVLYYKHPLRHEERTQLEIIAEKNVHKLVGGWFEIFFWDIGFL